MVLLFQEHNGKNHLNLLSRLKVCLKDFYSFLVCLCVYFDYTGRAKNYLENNKKNEWREF